jgi:hypothetical protein
VGGQLLGISSQSCWALYPVVFMQHRIGSGDDPTTKKPRQNSSINALKKLILGESSSPSNIQVVLWDA